MPAASPALARSTNKRVRSSGFRALAWSGTVVLPFGELERVGTSWNERVGTLSILAEPES
jgi:hypothetical protein